MSAFCNNLQKGDTVEDVKTKRRGKVANTPRETTRKTQIQWADGPKTQVDILRLRLVIGNEVEDCPPCDGEPEEDKTISPVQPVVLPTPIQIPKVAAPRKVDTEYVGDIKLERLLTLREELRVELAKLDESLLNLRVDIMIKRRLEPIRTMAEVEERCDIAQNIIQIRNATKKAREA